MSLVRLSAHATRSIAALEFALNSAELEAGAVRMRAEVCVHILTCSTRPIRRPRLSLMHILGTFQPIQALHAAKEAS